MDNITQRILKLRIAYAKQYEVRPYEINNGQCEDFAYDLSHYGFGEPIWGDELASFECWSAEIKEYPDWFSHSAPIHCFTRYHGKYYDSECPQGCDYPDQLPCYQREKHFLRTGVFA